MIVKLEKILLTNPITWLKKNFVPIEPILARFKVRPEKPSSPEIQSTVSYNTSMGLYCT